MSTTPDGNYRWERTPDGVWVVTPVNPYEAPQAYDRPEDYPAPPPARRQPRFWLPVMLFLLTCFTTYRYGMGGFEIWYAVPLMGILLTHEFGHWLQARRYHVPASLPYFVPMPFPPLGTMGAVIVMRGRFGNRRTIFDIGITGPLAGLVPTLLCSVVGLYWSHVGPAPPVRMGGEFAEPLLFKGLVYLIFGELGPNETVYAHSLALAGWVGMLVTSLNLFPIGQLDGGHVLYALLRERAHPIASLVLLGAAAAVIYFGLYGWSVMLMLLALMGPKHPPTANDDEPIGPWRVALGWLTLAFVIVGFTPDPFLMNQ